MSQGDENQNSRSVSTENLAADEASDAVACEAPQRIWICTDGHSPQLATWATDFRPCDVEYVRADSHAQQWQPIETAPTDGTRILAYPVFGKVGVVTWWRSNIHKDGGSFIDGNMAVRPTQWMPLPAPPNPITQAESGFPSQDVPDHGQAS